MRIYKKLQQIIHEPFPTRPMLMTFETDMLWPHSDILRDGQHPAMTFPSKMEPFFDCNLQGQQAIPQKERARIVCLRKSLSSCCLIQSLISKVIFLQHFIPPFVKFMDIISGKCKTNYCSEHKQTSLSLAVSSMLAPYRTHAFVHAQGTDQRIDNHCY